MWVPGAFAYLVAGLAIVAASLNQRRAPPRHCKSYARL
jgi:hypothetical protein